MIENIPLAFKFSSFPPGFEEEAGAVMRASARSENKMPNWAFGTNRGPAGGPPAITERREEVLRLAEAGKSNREIAKILGIANATAFEHRRALKTAGLLPEKEPKRERPAPQATIQLREDILRLSEEGLMVKQICERLRVGKSTVVAHRQVLRTEGRL